MSDLALLQSQLLIAEKVTHLLPRRRSIYETIQEQKMVSADYLYRNFAGTPQSTIRYELKELQNLGIIKKLGTTRGALYTTC